MSDTQRRTATGAGALGGYVWSQQMEKQEMQAATQGKGVAVTQTADKQLKLDIPSDARNRRVEIFVGQR